MDSMEIRQRPSPRKWLPALIVALLILILFSLGWLSRLSNNQKVDALSRRSLAASDFDEIREKY